MAKIAGKKGDKYKLGFGVSGYYDFHINEIGNNSARIGLLDLAVLYAVANIPLIVVFAQHLF